MLDKLGSNALNEQINFFKFQSRENPDSVPGFSFNELLNVKNVESEESEEYEIEVVYEDNAYNGSNSIDGEDEAIKSNTAEKKSFEEALLKNLKSIRRRTHSHSIGP